MGILALIETRVPQNPVAESLIFPYPKNAIKIVCSHFGQPRKAY